MPQPPLHLCGLSPRCLLRQASILQDRSNFFEHSMHLNLRVRAAEGTTLGATASVPSDGHTCREEVGSDMGGEIVGMYQAGA
jgi:hypothetical protein